MLITTTLNRIEDKESFKNLQINLHLKETVSRIRDGEVQLPQIIHVVQHVYEAKGENSHHVKGKRQQEQKKVAVVSSADAVVHPGTVMVKVLERTEKCF